MDTTKIIKGVVGGGRYTVTAPIMQEHYGIILKIEGAELPETYQVDFSNDEHHGTSVTMIGNADGVKIPRQFIDTGKDVFAFLYWVGEDYGKTVYKFRIPNKLRPDRTDEQPTPEQQSTIDQAINALNSAVKQTAQDVIDAEQASDSANDYAERARQLAINSSESASQASTSAQSASQSASQASASATVSAQSAGQAMQSEQNAQASAEEAQGYASASAQSATASANSASQASGYAQSANSFANEAHSFAVSAQTSAQTASTKASEASASADLASRKASEITGLTAQANTLPSGSSATASYSNGTLTLGIPQGADGDDYVLTVQDKQDIADLVDAGGMVVNATLVSGTQYTIDSTYDAIKTALSAGKTVVVMTGGVPQPYVGNVQLYNEWYLAFGVSTIYDNIATLTGFMIPQTYQNVAIWTQQNTTIPQLNDVQINGQSIVADGVANVPVATNSAVGVVRTSDLNGTDMSGSVIRIYRATAVDIKTGTQGYRPITPSLQQNSVFYGLAKASGDSTQSSSSNAVGEYTEDAKSAIQTMLGIADLIGNSEGATASQAYSVGDVFLHKGKLYKATASIAQGSAIVPNTNCSQTTIIDLLRGV